MIIPVFGFDTGQKSSNVTAQQRFNLYAEVKVERDKTNMVLYRTPGLLPFITSLGANPFRGLWKNGNFLYGPIQGQMYQISNTPVATPSSGSMLSTTVGNVDMVDNGTQVLIVDGTAGYILTLATNTLATIASGNFPNGATTCAVQAGFFLVDDPAHPGRFYKSASLDGTTWSATDFATAESSPDALVRVFVNNDIVHLMGTDTIEFWANTGALDFPYARIQGTTIAWGLAAKWSAAVLNGQVTFIASNSGQIQAVQLAGFQPQVISSPEVEARWATYTTTGDAIGFAHDVEGHQVYEVTFPTANESWLYDFTSSQVAGVPVWSRLTSNGGRHLSQFHQDFIDQHIVSDYSSGNLYKMSTTTYTDNGTSILWKLIGKHVFKNNEMMTIGKLWVDVEGGVGTTTGQGNNPQVMLRVSKDGGHTWGSELWRSMGAIGKYLTRLIWTRLGRARDWVFEISGSDPVKVVIMNAGMILRQGRE